jgi:glycine/D-amino acid oxidase-like deaminating enzyme
MIKWKEPHLSQEAAMGTTSRSVETCDVSVIGGGILGLAVAALAAKANYHVVLFRLSNQGKPRADTLRNQGWLQSGLMYVGKLGADRRRGRILANRMYYNGLLMLDALGLPRPIDNDRGILRVHGDGDAQSLLADAKEIGVQHIVQELSAGEARERLGPLFDGGRYFRIPDAPFPEGVVLRRLREQGELAGAAFIEPTRPVRLLADPQSPSGVSVECDGRCFRSRATVVAAGAGAQELLQGLGIEPRMRIQQTPLLVVDGDPSISAPIFVDRPGRFSFVLHPREEEHLPRGAFVVGTSVVEEDVACRPYDERAINASRAEEFLGILPGPLRRLAEGGRFTAGYEVVPHEVDDGFGNHLHFVEPWVEWLRPAGQEKTNLLLAMPGRATMGVAVADRVLELLEERIGDHSQGSLRSEVAGRWVGDIFMHFHNHYGFDDREAPEEGS